MTCRTLSVASAAPQPPQQNTSLPNPTGPRPGPSQTQSAPVLVANAHGASSLPQDSSKTPENASALARPVARGYTTHLPYNPSRPPPHTYTRQHEFPPFPPLAQHPVLPFLTTAFASTQESRSAPPPTTKTRSAAPPRAGPAGKQNFVSTIPTMDVSKNDPTATFIRPPLVVPFLHNGPSIDPSCVNGSGIDGEPAPGTPLTYPILHTHRNWFLDADDFRKDNPNRIDYPPDLEPPRGWAPLSECTGAGAANRCKQAKEKKEKNNAVRTKGSYAHPDLTLNDITIEYGPSDDCHEKTVLRCTFCRREYHGPNAKSMWRRHVFDKHKVAMKNRREGSAGMAPRLAQMQKKAKVKAAEPSGAELGVLVDLNTPALTLDLTNEENLIRLLERVVSGDIDINLPGSLLNSGSNGGALSLEAMALALQKSGVSLTVDGDKTSTIRSVAGTGAGPSSGVVVKTTHEPRKHEEQGREREQSDEKILGTAAGPSLAVDDDMDMLPHSDLSPTPRDEAKDAVEANQPKLPIFESPFPVREADLVFYGQKRKAEVPGRNLIPISPNLGRAPLKDNTVLDRNNYNQGFRTAPTTPGNDKGKQKAVTATPGLPKLSQQSLDSSGSPRHPYTPVKPPAALRSQALATTGEESYLTLIAGSPATASPDRGSSRVPSTSPFRSRNSPTKRTDRNYPSTSDDAFGDFSAPSPRYPFDFNVQASSSISAFDPIPLELGNSGPAHWTPPSLAPPAPVSEPSSRSISRASSIGDDDPDTKHQTLGDDSMELEYPRCSSPSERALYRRRSSVEDFDMDAYLDLKDAGSASESDSPPSPYKNTVTRGLQFSKEYGLLSPSEVERITASAHPKFMEESRSSKRRRVEIS